MKKEETTDENKIRFSKESGATAKSGYKRWYRETDEGSHAGVMISYLRGEREINPNKRRFGKQIDEVYYDD